MNKNNYLKFEHYCINLHSNKYNEETYHWSNIPDDILIESKYFESYEVLRLKRKNKKENQDNINELREYGLDGISRCIIENKYIYNGLQMKLWNNTL